jgi:hypothetical protein
LHTLCAIAMLPLPRFFIQKAKPPPYLCQYCHTRILTGTIRTASVSSFQRHHCHPTTATRYPAVIDFLLHLKKFLTKKSIFAYFFTMTLSLPILPLPPSNWYHSNRLGLLFPTPPLPPCHCHSLPQPGPPCVPDARPRRGDFQGRLFALGRAGHHGVVGPHGADLGRGDGGLPAGGW